jgi:hypothetical protein
MIEDASRLPPCQHSDPLHNALDLHARLNLGPPSLDFRGYLEVTTIPHGRMPEMSWNQGTLRWYQ